MKIVFMGTPEFALPTLERLIESPHEVALVVTQPDKQAGRGRQTQAPPIKRLALERGLDVEQFSTLRDGAAIERVRAIAPDAIVVVAYGKILPPDLLAVPRLGCINIHASLLPAYRGAAPINWAIVRGATQTGVTIMQMDAGMDTGAIIYQESIPILDDDDARSVSGVLSVLGASALVDVLDAIERTGKIDSRPQDESMVSCAPTLKKEDGLIDWSLGTDRIVCLVRGLLPWPGAFTPTRRGTMRILQAEPLWPGACEEIQEDPLDIKPATIALTLRSNGFAVRTGDGFLLVTKAQMQGKRAMSGVDMVNGRFVKTGDVLSAE